MESWFQVIHVYWRQMGDFLLEILMYFFSVCVCVYACVPAVCLQPAVPVWWTDLGSIMSPAGVQFRVVASAPLALWVIRIHLQQAYPKHSTALKGVARSKRSLCGFYWFPHLSASLLLLITDQDSKLHKALGYRSTAVAICSVTGRLHCVWGARLLV